MNIKNKDGWFFKNPEKNEIYYLTDMEVEQLFQLAKDEDQWAKNVYDEVVYKDKHPGGDFLINEIRTINAPGTVVRYPFNIAAITFPSRRHLFRGEPQIYKASIPSLNRKIKGRDKKMWEALAKLRVIQFHKFIWKIDVVPYWEAKLGDINILALAQHYGFDTHLLDLTNDVMVALFFATCQYVPESDSYRPLTEKECEDRKYGVIFHTPDWTMDYFQPSTSAKLWDKMEVMRTRPLSIEDGEVDGIAFQIGMQPLMRCHHQSGYIYPMVENKPLQDNWWFEKLYIKLTSELSEKVFKMMDGGKKVFPNEGISEARSVIEEIKKSFTFSEDDLLCLSEDMREKIRDYDFDGKRITVQNGEVGYNLPQETWDAINAKYNGKDLLAPTGGMFHYKPEEKIIRDARCVEIYGKMID